MQEVEDTAVRKNKVSDLCRVWNLLVISIVCMEDSWGEDDI